MLAVCVAVVQGCGGQVSGSPDAGGDGRAPSGSSSGSNSASGGSSGSGTTSGSGGGSGGQVPLCSPDPPEVGVSCATTGQGCAYFVGAQCEGYRCTSDKGWQLDPTVTCP